MRDESADKMDWPSKRHVDPARRHSHKQLREPVIVNWANWGIYTGATLHPLDPAAHGALGVDRNVDAERLQASRRLLHFGVDTVSGGRSRAWFAELRNTRGFC